MEPITKTAACEVLKPAFYDIGNSISTQQLMHQFGDAIAYELMFQIVEGIIKEFQKNPVEIKQMSFTLTCAEINAN